MKPAHTMTHESREDCKNNPLTQMWIAWAERHGLSWEIVKSRYYNLPERSGRAEAYDDDGRTRPDGYYWELAIDVDRDDRPEHPSVVAAKWSIDSSRTAEENLDAAIAKSKKLDKEREEEKKRRLEDLQDAIERIPEIPRKPRLGSKFGDELWDMAKGKGSHDPSSVARTLAEGLRDGLIETGVLRDEVRQRYD